MHRRHHLADAATFHMALASGMLDEPRPAWDPDTGRWVIKARPRRSGEDWVLGQGPRPTGFGDQAEAWRTVQEMRRGVLQ